MTVGWSTPLFGAVVVLAGACSLTTDLSGYSTGPTTTSSPAPDADAIDAGAFVVDDATDAKVDASVETSPGPSVVNLHPNGDFEATLDPWIGFHGTIDASSTARSGTKSVRICSKIGPQSFFTVDDTGTLPNPISGTYRVSAWVRADPLTAAVPETVEVHLRSRYHGDDVDNGVSPSVAPGATWQKVETSLVLGSVSVDDVDVYVEGQGPTGCCFLVDDVVLERLP